jgi:hypothetical protein
MKLGHPNNATTANQSDFELTAPPMEAVFDMIDRAKIRRRSVEMDAPACDRNLIVKILVAALALERESYRRRGRYQHRGKLGDLGIDLLRVLTNLGRKHGRIFPSYETLAYALRKNPETVVEAMKRLIAAGFVTKHRRSKKIGTPQGERRVQDSNAYELHMPGQESATSAPLIARASGSENPSVPERSGQDSKTKPCPERWWLADPLEMGNGSTY